MAPVPLESLVERRLLLDGKLSHGSLLRRHRVVPPAHLGVRRGQGVFEGRAVARNIQNRHATLSRFFSLFGLDAETQRADIEGIEHHLSPATLEMLADLAAFFEHDATALRVFKQFRKRGIKR